MRAANAFIELSKFETDHGLHQFLRDSHSIVSMRYFIIFYVYILQNGNISYENRKNGNIKLDEIRVLFITSIPLTSHRSVYSGHAERNSHPVLKLQTRKLLQLQNLWYALGAIIT